MTNHAKIGGVLSIVAGAFGVLGLLGFLFMAVLMMFLPGEFNRYGYTREGVYIFLMVFYIILGICHAIFGVLAIVGGVFALRKKHWGWALAGSIAGTITFFPCGIPAIIFTALGKTEFQAAIPGPING